LGDGARKWRSGIVNRRNLALRSTEELANAPTPRPQPASPPRGSPVRLNLAGSAPSAGHGDRGRAGRGMW
jgi:hypothetical protein